MDFIISVVALLVVSGICAYYSVSKYIWSPALFITSVSLFALSWISLSFFLILLIGVAGIGVMAFMDEWRIRWLITPIAHHVKKNMPTISHTEQEAIDAGNVWWEKELFSGLPNWNRLFEFKFSQLSQDEQHFLDHQVDALCAQLNDWEIITEKKDLPPDVWAFMKKERFFGLVIPKEYGGLGFSSYAHSCIVIKIASRCISAAVSIMVPNSLGPAELLLHYGTEDQKNYYLPRLASGEEIPCFGLTAPLAGSDASSIPDFGIVCREKWNGAETIGIRLTWDKRYITLAPIATLLGIAFHLEDPDHILGNKKDLGITLCLVPSTHPGVEIGHRHIPLHHSFMNGTMRGKNVFIPIDWIIGGVAMVGQGWRMLMESLSVGRSVSLPALATSCAKTTYRYTATYAMVRRQFGLPISEFEGIQAALTEMAGFTYLMDAARSLTVSAADQGIKPTITSAIIKYHLTEKGRLVMNHAMDIHAGHGIQSGPRNFLAHSYMGMPISITVEGANILTRNLIIFGQGAIRCHPFLLQEIQQLKQLSFDAIQFDRLLMEHMSYWSRNKVRSFWHGLTRGYFIPVFRATPVMRRSIQVMTRMSAVLAYLSDIAFVFLGGSLKRREHLSARLGDILSELYLASSVMAYFKHHCEQAQDIPSVKWCVEYCMHRAEEAAWQFCSNFPNRFIRWTLKWVVFPSGRMHSYPKDDLGKAVLTAMKQESSLRNRLTRECYVPSDPRDTKNKLDRLFVMLPKYEFLHKQLKKLGLGKLTDAQLLERFAAMESTPEGITSEDIVFLKAFYALHDDVIQVDEFSFDLKTCFTK